MAKMTGNVFGAAAASRKAEQESIEQTIKASESLLVEADRRRITLRKVLQSVSACRRKQRHN